MGDTLPPTGGGMPWKECHVMDERLRFVARLLEGEKMAPLCAEFGISRKTGYKIFDRYKDCGVAGLQRSEPPRAPAGESVAGADRGDDRALEAGVSGLGRAQDPRKAPAAVHRPAPAGHQHGPRGARSPRPGAPSAPAARHAPRGPSSPDRPNRMRSGVPTTKANFCSAIARYCYPLTITDFASRYLLTCEALLTTQEKFAFTVFERTFKEFGLPQVIRTDNGVPFASAHALYGLSKLAVWWLRLGIQIERIKPGHPQQNGRHERMHLTLKREATKPAAANVLQQQARFDDFITRYNTDRPHQALGMKVPADVYARSPRVYRGLEELTYPFHDQTIMVTGCGRICFRGRKVNLSHVFAGQSVGVTQVGERIWLVTFMHYDLGYFDDETCRLEPIENPFGPKVLPIRSE